MFLPENAALPPNEQWIADEKYENYRRLVAERLRRYYYVTTRQDGMLEITDKSYVTCKIAIAALTDVVADRDINVEIDHFKQKIVDWINEKLPAMMEQFYLNKRLGLPLA